MCMQDLDENGKLDEFELRSGLNRMGLAEDEVDSILFTLLRDMDSNGDLLIDEEEFCRSYMLWQRTIQHLDS